MELRINVPLWKNLLLCSLNRAWPVVGAAEPSWLIVPGNPIPMETFRPLPWQFVSYFVKWILGILA
jgi:hypothetical protein